MGKAMVNETQIPVAYRQDIDKAVAILKKSGCTDIFLFGSLTTGKADEESADIDLAVRGCPQGEFFHLFGRLLLELEHPVDLIRLDKSDRFAEYLEMTGELMPIG